MPANSAWLLGMLVALAETRSGPISKSRIIATGVRCAAPVAFYQCSAYFAGSVVANREAIIIANIKAFIFVFRASGGNSCE